MFKYSRFVWLTMPMMLIIIVSLITALNNYFFYKSREISELRTLNQYNNLVLLELNQCLSLNITENICEKIAINTIDQARISGISTLQKNDLILIKKDHERFKDSRKPIKASSSLHVNANTYSIELEKLITPSLITSTFNSMTFSIHDLLNMNETDKENFIENVAWPRSYPAISFFVVIFISFFLAGLKLKSLHSTIEKIQNQKDLLSNDLSSSKIELSNKENQLASLSKEKEEQEGYAKTLTDEINTLEHSLYEATTISDNKRKQITDELIKLKTKKEQSDLINKSLASKISITKSELASSNNKILELESTIEKLQSDEIKIKESKSFSPIKNELIKYLLSNPDINIKNNQYKVNTGPHHSKQFVEKLDSVIKNSKKFEKLHKAIKSLTPIAYSQKRGIIELILDPSKKIYVLNIYDNGDEGFGAQIALATENYFEALMISKCLINTLTPISSFKLKLR